MSAYFDTGVVVKWYVPEAGSTAALSLRRRFRPPAPLTPLHRLELTTAWHLKVFRGEIKLIDATCAADDLQTDIEAGIWSLPVLDHAAVFSFAETLGRAHASKLGTRALDILHVATAVTLGVRDFVTTDARQAALAKAARLKVTGS